VTNSSQSWGLTILRVVTGIVFFIHGYQKLFHIGIHGVTGFFAHFGIPLPAVAAVIVTLVEFVGGLLLITGLATRVAAGLNAIDMTVAILVVHLKNGFSGPMGFEHPFTLLGACICLVLAGGGALSLKSL
jgi:putative oxidoreductase